MVDAVQVRYGYIAAEVNPPHYPDDVFAKALERLLVKELKQVCGGTDMHNLR